MTVLDDRTTAEILDIGASEASLSAFERQGTQCGWCREPVRLVGDDGSTYLKGCGTRRATRCPACASRYRGDARAIVLSGVAGGKGVPVEVREAPTAFVTLTAPSFGPVHRASAKARRTSCRLGRERHCPHGVDLRCHAIHTLSDKRVGEPLCADCYDYEGAVAWNAAAPELWRRFTIALRRQLARSAGVSVRHARLSFRVSFVKVAEYQRRGSVHFHALVRIDGPEGPGSVPAIAVSGTELAQAVFAAAGQVRAPVSTDDVLSFGSLVDVAIVGEGVRRRRVANYLAKYVTKSTDEHGVLDRRLRSPRETRLRRLEWHHRRLVEAAWGPHLLGDAHARRWSHALGFGGHWMTKSRVWSTTFGVLRAERAAWRRTAESSDHATPSESSAGEVPTAEPAWRFVGRGWSSAGEAVVAETRWRDRDIGLRESALERIAASNEFRTWRLEVAS